MSKYPFMMLLPDGTHHRARNEKEEQELLAQGYRPVQNTSEETVPLIDEPKPKPRRKPKQ